MIIHITNKLKFKGLMIMNNLLEGKRGLIMGVANDRSLAWGIAKSCSNAGAELAFTYQSEALKKRVTPLAMSVGSNHLIECDVGDMRKKT